MANIYNKKYIIYKNKYLKLKKKIYGGSKEFVVGINYEGGKIIKHILEYPTCIAYANLQIAMDAPYHDIPRIANEKLRLKGRSETQFDSYDENKLKEKLEELLSYIKETYYGIKIVIQIARGKASVSTFCEVIKPLLDKLKIVNFEYIFGYRTINYYKPIDDTQFVFVNYGMFAELSNDIKVHVGEICNPVITYDIQKYIGNEFIYDGETSFEKNDKNILNRFPDIKKLKLFGIDDKMPFVTPDIYDKKDITNLVKKVDN